MSWLVQKLEEYKRNYEPISIAGIISYPITLYNFLNQTDDALRERFNGICGTNYSRDSKWSALKKEPVIREAGSSSGFLRGVRSRAVNIRSALKTLGVKPHLWYLAQEASYISAVLPLQVEAGLYMDREGGGVLSSVGANLMAGSAASWTRRAVLFWHADKSVSTLLKPTSAVCSFAKEFEKAPLPKAAKTPVKSDRVMPIEHNRGWLEGVGEFFRNLPDGIKRASNIVAASSFVAAACAVFESLASGVAAVSGFFVLPGASNYMQEGGDRELFL